MSDGDGVPSSTPAGRMGMIIGRLVGFGFAIVAFYLTGAILYKANGEQHAVGPAWDAGIVFIVSAPIGVALGGFVGRRVALRRVDRASAAGSIPPRPD